MQLHVSGRIKPFLDFTRLYKKKIHQYVLRIMKN